MSFQLYLQCFNRGKPSGFTLGHVRRAFGAPLVELEEDFWQLRFSDSESSDLFLQPLAADPSLVHTISVYRACADPRLWVSLHRMLTTPGTILHFPGCAAPLAHDVDAAVAAMPPDLLESLGAPQRAAGPADLVRAVDNV